MTRTSGVLAAELVRVWLARPLPDALRRLGGELGPDERRWAERIGVTADRDRFVTTRVLARRVLAGLGAEPTAGELHEERPTPIRTSDGGPSCCVSHTADVVAVAVRTAGALGVDVETVDSARRIARLIGGRRNSDRLLADWARCEALAKAVDGSVLPLVRDGLRAARTGVHPDATHRPMRLASTRTSTAALAVATDNRRPVLTLLDGDRLLAA